MKFTKTMISVSSIALLAGLVFVTSPTGAAQTAEKQAKQAVSHYLNAVLSGNINEIIKYSKDERVPDDIKRKEVLEQFLQENPIKKFEVLSVKYVSDENITVTLSGQFGETIETRTLPLIKENNQWKVLITDN